MLGLVSHLRIRISHGSRRSRIVIGKVGSGKKLAQILRISAGKILARRKTADIFKGKNGKNRGLVVCGCLGTASIPLLSHPPLTSSYFTAMSNSLETVEASISYHGRSPLSGLPIALRPGDFRCFSVLLSLTLHYLKVR